MYSQNIKMGSEKDIKINKYTGTGTNIAIPHLCANFRLELCTTKKGILVICPKRVT